jgi:hypothetical protein
MYALEVTHIFYHAKYCKMNHNPYKQTILEGELNTMEYDFSFVIGPTLDVAHEQLASIPLLLLFCVRTCPKKKRIW